jgi:hypothetical protein
MYQPSISTYVICIHMNWHSTERTANYLSSECLVAVYCMCRALYQAVTNEDKCPLRELIWYQVIPGLYLLEKTTPSASADFVMRVGWSN